MLLLIFSPDSNNNVGSGQGKHYQNYWPRGKGKGQRAIARDLGISRIVVKHIKEHLSSRRASKGYERKKRLDAHKDIIGEPLS